jgi:hypothetical protein
MLATFTDCCCASQISMCELHKFVPLALQQFEFELEDPVTPWKTKDFWFNKQSGIRARVQRHQ